MNRFDVMTRAATRAFDVALRHGTAWPVTMGRACSSTAYRANDDLGQAAWQHYNDVKDCALRAAFHQSNLSTGRCRPLKVA
ncbi:MAG: hypothetical protein V4510_12415 [bacterium]